MFPPARSRRRGASVLRPVVTLSVPLGLEWLELFRRAYPGAAALPVEAPIAAEPNEFEAQVLDVLRDTLVRLGLPLTAPEANTGGALSFIGHDKKRKGSTLRFALPTALGEGEVFELSTDEVRLAIELAVGKAA